MAKSKKKKSIPKKVKKKVPVSFWKNRQNLIALAIVLLVTTIVFLPSLNNEFVNWDDDKNFYENPYVQNSSNFSKLLENTKGIFTTPVIGNYNPLSNFSFAVENAVFGLDKPFYWHLDNLLLHLLCVLLVFRIALALGLNIWASVLCALLFGIHPMRIESVAWVTERKDVLFGAFYLAALYYYIKGVKEKTPNKYLIRIVLLFFLSGLSKIQAVSLPLSMLCIDYFLGRKVEMKRIFEKWFYFAISILIGLIGIYFLKEQGSLDSAANFSFFQRLFVGSYSYIVYLIKLIIPYQLSPMYPYPPSLGTIFYVSMIPALGIIGFLFYSFKKGWKALTFGLLFFSVNIVFLLQIVGAGQGFIADRFTYIAYFGLFFSIAYYLQILHENKKRANIISALVTAALVVFSVISFNQIKIWKDSGTLWTHVLKYYPNTTLPWGNRANFNRDKGLITQALFDYDKAIALKSTNSQPYNSRAKLYFRSNSRDTLIMALQDYTKAIELEPEKGEFYMNRGATYARLQDLNASINDLIRAAELEPQNPVVFLNRSIVYHQMRQYQNEINDINHYLTLNPNNGNMWANRGSAYLALRQFENVLADLNQAIAINPNNGTYFYYRAQYYYNIGDSSTAQADLNRARQLGFKFNGTIENLAL